MNSIYDHISNTPDLSDSLSHSQTAGRDPINPSDLENSYESQENPGQKISREISQRNPLETREIWAKSRQIQKILANLERSTFSEQDGFYEKNSLENSQLEKSNRVII